MKQNTLFFKRSRIYDPLKLFLLFFLFSPQGLFAQTAKTGPKSVLTILNGGFETPVLSPGTFASRPNTPGWTFTGATHITSNGSAILQGNPNAPAGSQVLVLQFGTSIASTTISFPNTGVYRIRFKAAQRAQYNVSQTIGVYLGDYEIGEITPSDISYRNYFSVPFHATSGTSYTLKLKGLNGGVDNSALIDEIKVEEVYRWNENDTWISNTIPGTLSNATIPKDAFVAMDGNCNAKMVMVHGSLAATNNLDLTFSSEAIIVMGEKLSGTVIHSGIFEMGRLETPYSGNAQISLLGNNPALSYHGMGSKVLASMNGGIISLHGKDKKAWTLLNATVLAGSNTIKVSEKVNWSIGDKIVIASSHFDMYKAEEATITAISSDGLNLTLNNFTSTSKENVVTTSPGFIYKHFGKLQTYTSGSNSWTLDERAEVGLLTRNIKIVGADAATSKFGGHVMVHGAGSKGYISNVEFFHMGQESIVGRYPFHWHLVGDATGQYIRNSSVHHTFNRAITIHRTSYTKVENNFAYDNMGHAYFMEDGVECGNVIKGNVGLITRRPAEAKAILGSDYQTGRNSSGPATFWITNPNNFVNFNRAAGSDGSGFWLAPHLHCSNIGVEPNNVSIPVGGFDNNIAHSNYHGWVIGTSPHYQLNINQNEPCHFVDFNRDYSPATAPTFKNITVYKNVLGLYSRINPNPGSSYEDLIVADNYSGDASTWETYYDRVLWVGGSENYEDAMSLGIDPTGPKDVVPMHIIYDGPVHVTNSHFASVDKPGMSLLDQWNSEIKFTGHTFYNTTVDQRPYQVLQNEDYRNQNFVNAVVYDMDGTLTGTGEMTAITKDHPILIDEESKRIISTPVLPNNPKRFYNGMESPHRYGYVEIVSSEEIKNQPEGKKRRQTSTFVRSDGAVSHDPGETGEGATLAAILNGKYTYKLYYHDALPSEVFLKYYSMNGGEHIIVGIVGEVEDPDNIRVSTHKVLDNYLPRKNDLTSLKAFSGSGWSYQGGVTYIKYQAPSGSSFTDNVMTGYIYFCPDGDCFGHNYSYFGDYDGDGYTDEKERALNRDPYDVNDLGFNFYHSNEGWKKSTSYTAECGSPCFNNWNSWYMKSTDQDPYIYRTGFLFEGSNFPNIQALVRSEIAGSFKLYWTTTEEPGFSELKSVEIPYSNINHYENLVFNVSGNSRWNGKIITRLRLDAPAGLGHTWFRYIRAKNNSLYCINRQPETGDMTEITTLDGADFYKYKAVGLEKLPSANIKNTNNRYEAADFDLDGITDLVCISQNSTNNSVEFEVLNGRNNFKTASVTKRSSGLPFTHTKDHFKVADYDGDNKPDLWMIEHNTTLSNKTELKIADGDDDFGNVLATITTGLHKVTNPNDAFVVGDYNGDGINDLWWIRSNNFSGYDQMEVHILSGSTNFQIPFIAQHASLLPANQGDWTYSVTDYNGDGKDDLMAINKQGVGGKVEVIVLSAVGGFKTTLLHQTTNLPNVGPDWIFSADKNPSGKITLNPGQSNYRVAVEKEDDFSSVSPENVHVSFNLYPNPTKELINLDLSAFATNELLEIKIINNLGVEMHKELLDAGGNYHSIKTDQLEPGQYFMVVKSRLDGTVVKKFNVVK